jgi:predicted TIM-barrel fold metal-dependent hydrolase
MSSALATSGIAAMTGSILVQANSPVPTVEPRREARFVDVHVHITQQWNERGELTARSLIRWMDVGGIEQAWVLPLISPEAWFYPITTEFVLEQTKQFRERLIPFCIIDPRTDVFGGRKHFVDLLGRYKDAGARGFGEHKWGGAVDDSRNIELMRACAEVELPVLFHLDNHRNTDTPGLPGLEKLLKAVPNVTLIGHGPGWWASISGTASQKDLGGYPTGDVAPGGALDRLLGEYPNLFADLSAGSGHNAIRRDLEFGHAFLNRNADKILFGTDYLAEKQQVKQFDLLSEMKLPDDVQERIFRGNARKLMGDP